MGHAKPWTEEDKAQLRALWPTCTVRQIALALERYTGKVRSMAEALGLPKKPKGRSPSITVGRSRGETQRRAGRPTDGLRRWRCAYSGCGRLVKFSGMYNCRKNRVGVTIGTGAHRLQALPPRGDLVDAGDWSLDWHSDAGRRQLAVAILAYLRPERQLIEPLIRPFLQEFGRRFDRDYWELPGAEVERWLRERAQTHRLTAWATPRASRGVA